MQGLDLVSVYRIIFRIYGKEGNLHGQEAIARGGIAIIRSLSRITPHWPLYLSKSCQRRRSLVRRELPVKVMQIFNLLNFCNINSNVL